MCGIVGYVGLKPVMPILLDSLEKLEYRGYDSAGVALISDSGIMIRKTRGRIADLRRIVASAPADDCTVGMEHQIAQAVVPLDEAVKRGAVLQRGFLIHLAAIGGKDGTPTGQKSQ